MRVSIILPCRNEARHLGPCLDSILGGTWPLESLEVLVVDGESDDGTREVAEGYAASLPIVRLLANPRRTAPAALNVGLAAASGEVIVRMDAHVLYPADYVARLVRRLIESGADNVGGRVETVPGGTTAVARAIARAMAHPFGVGNSQFRLRAPAPRFVDTVPFGCFRREVFDRVGQFDEELVRNQDDEFNARIIRHGGRILLDPGIVARYVARPRLGQLARMYRQYGQFKPLVVRKIGSLTSARQLAPVALIIGIVTPSIVALALPPAWILTALLLGLYATAALGCAATAAREDGVRGTLARAAAFAVMHLSYGWGYLEGLTRIVVAAPLRSDPHLLPLSRGEGT